MNDNDMLMQYRHSANNCRQMLAAIDRKLARALECIYNDDYETCRELLEQLTSSLPEAMAIIAHENDEQREGKRREG